MNARIPRGFRDILPPEAALREAIAADVQQVFRLWGYQPVETPALEMVKPFQQHGFDGPATFKLFDSDGELLVLRPDITLPIARLVGMRLGVPAPGQALRLRYMQTVFREERVFATQARAFTQLGVECIGPDGLTADVEALLMLAEALDAAAIGGYTVALCTVSVLQDILDVAARHAAPGLSQAWRQAVLAAWHKSDLVGVDALMADPGVDGRFGRAISALARLQDGLSAIAACRRLIEGLSAEHVAAPGELVRCTEGLGRLERTMRLVVELRPDVEWLVDFSLMGSFDYYTGLMFQAFAPGSGHSLASGGRYDSTLAEFGADVPAIGFALSLERLYAARLEAEPAGGPEAAPSPHVVWADPDDLAAAFERSRGLRAAGSAAILAEGRR